MDEPKKCFMDAQRPCDLTCKASFEVVEDGQSEVDCYFIWAADLLGHGLLDLKTMMGMSPGPPFMPPGGEPPTPPGSGSGSGIPNN